MEQRISGVMQVLQYTADKTMELANANSVVGEIIRSDGVTIIPISKLSAGFAGGGAEVADVKKKRRNSPAGAGAKVTRTPMSFLVIQDGEVKMLSLSGEEAKEGNLISSIVSQAKGLFSKGSSE